MSRLADSNIQMVRDFGTLLEPDHEIEDPASRSQHDFDLHAYMLGSIHMGSGDYSGCLQVAPDASFSKRALCNGSRQDRCKVERTL